MPRIPGVPTLDPVSHPSESPGEAGKVGGSISQLGDAGQDSAATGQGLDLYIKKAQEHVDTMAARNELDAAYAQTQDQLAKTPNSRDVPDVIQQGNKNLNDISARWSKSPAAIAIQMDADALRPSLAHVGTVKQVDLMGKEFKITLSTQGEKLAAVYASGDRNGAEAAFGSAVDGGVKTGLVGDAEAQEYVRQFKQEGQKLEIRNAITNANPTVNQKIYDDITAHRDQYPDVTQEQLDTYKGQALAAFEAHTKFQEWAEGDMARKTRLPEKIVQYTNPATGQFDEAKAMTDNAEAMAKGEISESVANVMAQGFSSHQAQLQVGLKKEADKRLNDIEKDLSNQDFASAAKKLQENQPFFENNNLGADYRAALRYTHTAEVEVRAEAASARAQASAERTERRQEALENSQDTLGQVQAHIIQGGVFTKADLYDMAGTGKGQMRTQDVNAAWSMMQAYQTQPDFAAALKQLDDTFPTKSTQAHPLTADQIASANRKYAQTVEVFQQEVNAHPEKSKQEIMNTILKSKAESDIKDHANLMFGTVPASQRFSETLGAFKNFVTKPFTYGLKPGDAGYKAPEESKATPIVQHSPSTGKDRYSIDGGKTWLPGKPPQ